MTTAVLPAREPRVRRVRSGCSRTVLLVGGLALKVPTLRYGWRPFLRGLLCNMNEMDWRRNNDPRLCPIVWAAPGGWLLVMRRARELTPAEWVRFDRQAFDRSGDYAVPAEAKPDSFGVYAGRIVAVDYGD